MASSAAKTAVVTGASSGIGLGLVRAFLERGYAVVANSRSIDASTLAAQGVGPSRQLAVVPGDVGQRDVARRIVDAAQQRFGAIDVLVNNAGTFVSRPFTDYRVEELEALLSTNVHGFFHLTQLAVAQMLKRRDGNIVTITASISEQPLTGVPAVVPVLTKAALNAATRALALELATTGIRVNAVSPGTIETPMNASAPRDFLDDMQPMRRMGQVDDVVDAVLFLTTAPFVTGEVLHVDGGMTIGRWS